MGAFSIEGLVPNKEYIGIVEFYDPDFTPRVGRGRIRGYVGKELNRPNPFRLFEVFEKDIKTSLSFNNANRPILLEDEIVKFRVSISSVGFTATDVVVLMKVSPSVVNVEDLLERMNRNLSLGTGSCCPIGPSMPRLGSRVKTYEKPDLESDEWKETLPKIIKLSKKGAESEQKTQEQS